jgi:antirestriction protein ArdC
MLEAYTAFHDYSTGNQLLALSQCYQRGLQPGAIKTFPGWQAMGRNVKRGERAIVLCMPITGKRRTESGNTDDEPQTYTAFVYKPRWFVLSQTEGEELPTPQIPEYDVERALAALEIERIPFDIMDGNCQGFARRRQVAVNPVAQLPHKTLFHEVAHVALGHTTEGDFTDNERTPRSLRETEAEAVALLCCESLQLEGADYCRGYIQHWLEGDIIPEQSAQKIFRAADQILRAGRESKATAQPDEN